MKGVGKPCKGEPYARIEGGRLETEAPTTVTTVGRPDGKPREYRPWDLPPTTPPRLPPTLLRYGVSKATFGYLDQYAWHRVLRWLRKRHPRTKMAVLKRRYLPGWRPTADGVTMFDTQKVTVSRYRYRANNIPTPWARATTPGSAA